jgi:predicted dehydrogenase
MRFGLVGYGAIGVLRAQALRRTPGAELALIVEPVAERRAEAARLGIRTTASLDELLTDTSIDAVVVSTPPNLHRQHCEAVLHSGKHVLCEKPLAPSVEDCASIVEAAEREGRLLATGFNYRFYPAVAKARELVAAGRIGDLDHVRSFAGHPGGPEFTHQWVHNPQVVGGGALMDNGIHLADLTLHFLGDVDESWGVSSERVWEFAGSEDNGYVLMRTAAGRAGFLHASWTEWRGYHFSIEIYGTAGCIQASYPPMLTVLHDRPVGAAKRGRRHLYPFPVFQVLERLRSYRWTLVESFVAEQQDFMNRIAGQAGVGASGVDGLQAVKLVSSAYSGRVSSPSSVVARPAMERA